ncbi:9808_t:CDS:2, partial [Acaulospora colombiana]
MSQAMSIDFTSEFSEASELSKLGESDKSEVPAVHESDQSETPLHQSVTTPSDEIVMTETGADQVSSTSEVESENE